MDLKNHIYANESYSLITLLTTPLTSGCVPKWLSEHLLRHNASAHQKPGSLSQPILALALAPNPSLTFAAVFSCLGKRDFPISSLKFSVFPHNSAIGLFFKSSKCEPASHLFSHAVNPGYPWVFCPNTRVSWPGSVHHTILLCSSHLHTDEIMSLPY